MTSKQYKQILRHIALKAIKGRFPGLRNQHICEAATLIALSIHARMYGANVDGVDSPIWQMEDSKKPNVDASELLKETT